MRTRFGSGCWFIRDLFAMVLVVSVPFPLLEAALDSGASVSFYYLRNNPSLLVLSTSFALLRSSSFPCIDCSSLLYELVLQMFCARLLCKSRARSGIRVPACSSSRNTNPFPVPTWRKSKNRTIYVPRPKPAPVPFPSLPDFRSLYASSPPEITGDETFLRKHWCKGQDWTWISCWLEDVSSLWKSIY